MTNRNLSYILRNIDVSRGKVVRTAGNLQAVLMEGHKTKMKGLKHKFTHDYLVLLKDGAKAGLIQKCDCVDIHVYVYPKYRDQHIVSGLTGGGFLKALWPDIESVTCANRDEYDRVKHLAELAGYPLRN